MRDSQMKTKFWLQLNQIACLCLVLVFATFLWPHELQPTRFLCPWDFSPKNTGEDCHFILQGIFPTQGSNLYLLHCRQICLPLKLGGGSGEIGEKPFSVSCQNLIPPIHLCVRKWEFYQLFITNQIEPNWGSERHLAHSKYQVFLFPLQKVPSAHLSSFNFGRSAF